MLLTEVFHLNVKDHVPLTNWKPCCTSCLLLECNSDIVHSLAMESTQRVDPVHRSMTKASLTGFGRERPYLWVLGIFQVLNTLVFNQGYDCIAFLDDMEYPPVETRFIGNTHWYCKLSNLNGVRLLKVGQIFPKGTAILPSATDCYAKLRLSRDIQESSFVYSHSSSMVLCDVMCHAHARLSSTCFVIVCVECLV